MTEKSTASKPRRKSPAKRTTTKKETPPVEATQEKTQRGRKPKSPDQKLVRTSIKQGVLDTLRQILGVVAIGQSDSDLINIVVLNWISTATGGSLPGLSPVNQVGPDSRQSTPEVSQSSDPVPAEVTNQPYEPTPVELSDVPGEPVYVEEEESDDWEID
jgi:hypothetical protein